MKNHPGARMVKAIAWIATSLLMAACSSGGDGGGGTGPGASAPELTGTFVDAPVAGVAYTTSSGLSRVTDNQGSFRYRAADNITFSYGQTRISPIPIPAASQVTPWTVFGLNSPDPADPRWINLARVLQTFNNSLPAVSPAVQALPAIDFGQSPAAFTGDPAVANFLAAANAPQPLVSAAQAITTLGQQFAILGSWTAQNTFGPNFIVFTAMADGTFMISEDGSSDPAGRDGMERGTYSWNQVTGAFTATVQVDTNGENGLSHASPPFPATVSGNSLTFTPAGGTPLVLTRVVDTTAPIDPLVGAWRFDNIDGPGTMAVLTFFENGVFVLATDLSTPVRDGIERGTYTVAPNGDVTFIRTLDTNADEGFFDPAIPGPVVVNVAVNGDTVTVTEPGSPSVPGTRIRPPQ